MFNNIRKAIEAEYSNRAEAKKASIINGYIDPDVPQYNKPDYYLLQYLTDTRREAYEAGRITREKAIEYATARALREVEKDKAEEIGKLISVEAAGELIEATITIEWKRSATWGHNPTAELRYCFKRGDGEQWGHIDGSSVGGCGYDKESTAAAQVLNQCPEALKPLYAAKDAHMSENSHKAIGYGAGYAARPYFEGGVGISCFRSIYENLGYKWENVPSGKTFDVYRISKK